jgi:hypothetical protein
MAFFLPIDDDHLGSLDLKLEFSRSVLTSS